MKIEKLMTSKVRACAPTDTLETAAHLMWEGDCGIVPVVDAGGRPVGVLTDRDVCMSALFNGARLGEIPVARAMSQKVVSVPGSASVQEALELMRSRQLRRLPVVDNKGRLCGVISLADLALRWSRRESLDERELRADDVALTLAGICRSRREEPTAVMVVEIQPKSRPEAAQTGEAGPSRKGRADKTERKRSRTGPG